MVLAALLKQHQEAATTELLEAIAVLALGELLGADQQGLVVRSQPKAVVQQDLPLQMPLLFFLLKQLRQLTQVFIQDTEALEPLVLLGLQEVEEVKALEAAVLVEA